MPHPHRAVLQIAVIKAEAGVEDDFPHAVTLRDFNLPAEVSAHHFNGIGAEIEIAHFADVFALHVTNDDRRVVRGHLAIQLVGGFRAGEIQNVRARLPGTRG